MSADEGDRLNPAIAEALESVLGNPDADDVELFGRLRTLIENCVGDNYDQSDVRAVIQLAFAEDVVDEHGDSD